LSLDLIEALAKVITNNVIKLIYTDYTALEEGKKCVTIYLDLAKAFETIDHDKLLSKTQDIGITGLALYIIQSYLKNKKQKVGK